MRYQVSYSSDSPGTIRQFSADDDAAAVAQAQTEAAVYGDRIISLHEVVATFPVRTVEVPR